MKPQFGNADISQSMIASLDFVKPSVRTLRDDLFPLLNNLGSLAYELPTNIRSHSSDIEYTLLLCDNTQVLDIHEGCNFKFVSLADVPYSINYTTGYLPCSSQIAIDNVVSKIVSKSSYLSRNLVLEVINYIYETYYKYYYWSLLDTYDDVLFLEQDLETFFYRMLKAARNTEVIDYEPYLKYGFRLARKASKAFKILGADGLQQYSISHPMNNHILELLRSSITRRYVKESDDEPSANNRLTLAYIGDYDA